MEAKLDQVMERLDELARAAKTASIPVAERYMDAEEVGALLGFKTRYVAERLALRDDFPAPMRIDGTGHPRWLGKDILAWADKHRTTKEDDGSHSHTP